MLVLNLGAFFRLLHAVPAVLPVVPHIASIFVPALTRRRHQVMALRVAAILLLLLVVQEGPEHFHYLADLVAPEHTD